MESLGRPPASLSNLLGMIPLVLEVGCLSIPFVNFVRNGIEGHDLLHERGGNSGGEEANQDVMVRDASTSGVTLESRDVTFKRRGVLPIFLGHAVGG